MWVILSFSHQFYIFITAAATGLGLGAVYDVLRILRRIIKHPYILVQIEDGLYWIGAAVMAFFVMLNRFNGEVRPFVLLGTGFGMAVYFCLPSVFVMGVAERVISRMRRVLRRIERPVKRKCTALVYPVKKLKNFLGRKTKKFLHLCRVYAKLKMKHFIRDVKSVTKK